MTDVRHPDAEKGASPAAVTVGSDTYPVGDEGIIDCPADEASAVADVLADVYDTSAEELLDDDDDGKPPADADATEGCPFCDDYDGDHVGTHAAQAHPEAWADYKED